MRRYNQMVIEDVFLSVARIAFQSEINLFSWAFRAVQTLCHIVEIARAFTLRLCRGRH